VREASCSSRREIAVYGTLGDEVARRSEGRGARSDIVSSVGVDTIRPRREEDRCLHTNKGPGPPVVYIDP
jgi:hypothetical protein